MSPQEALLCATRDGGAVADPNGMIGTLEEGKLADFILVNGDPVADIKVLQDQSAITNVIKDGKFYTGLSDHNPYLSAEESEKNRKIKEEQLGKIEKEKIESAG